MLALSRRKALGVVAAMFAIAGQSTRAAGPAGTQLEDEPMPRRALAATAGPPVIPTFIRLRAANGTYCAITMEEYLKGVVPSEMPASWSIEALKAQAVAARTYATAYHATYGYICMTTACQAWDPTRRHANSSAAVDATVGELMTYQGGTIWAYYSSTCGGQSTTSPDQASVYCQAVRCWRDQAGNGRSPLDLSSEPAAAAFWSTSAPPESFCSISPSYRYSWAISRADQESIINQYLAGYTSVSPRYSAGQLGELTEVAVLARNSSGRATSIRASGTGGLWTLSGDTAIRGIFRISALASSQRSANLILTNQRNGTLTRVLGQGGGFGHGVGLCQYGAKGMADRGYDYQTILRQYYSNIAIVRASAARSVISPSRRFYLPLIGQPALASDPLCTTQ